ncbi:MAG: EF-P 5-aminopentanol modification-associated protein YfmH [Planctomycetaceae bacterium]
MKGTVILHDKALGEQVTRRVFPSGFTVYAARKPEFSRSYATLGVRYGSVDRKLPGNGALLPDGTAHFLEHKLFETPQGDAFDRFASHGASANAFTSFTTTRYLFGASGSFADNLRILLEMAFSFRVTDAGVEKEKGIIGQEIAMYADDPDWKGYFGLLGSLYARHPLRLDIAGTARTIAHISADLLRRVHAAYYHPRNMALAVVSPEPPATSFRIVQELVESRSFGPPPSTRGTDGTAEPRAVHRKLRRFHMAVKRPRLLLGFKDEAPVRRGTGLLRTEIASALALDCLFGNSGSIFLALYERGLVDENFSYSFAADLGHAFGLAGGETDDAPRLRRALEREMARARREGIAEAEFARVRNKALGDFARAYNAPESIAQTILSHHFRGTDLGDYREALFRVTRAELNRRLRALLRPDRHAYSVVVPR